MATYKYCRTCSNINNEAECDKCIPNSFTEPTNYKPMQAAANPKALQFYDDYIAFKKDVDRTWNKQDSEALDITIAALGLTGEAGEAGEVIKKHVEQGHPLDLEKLVIELGDTFYYMNRLLNYFGLSLTEVMETNVTKRQIRYPNGFSTADSVNRKV